MPLPLYIAMLNNLGYDDDKILGSAVDEAILERVKKGRNEVSVKLISGNLGFGIWQATSIISATHTKEVLSGTDSLAGSTDELLHLPGSGH